MAIMQGMKKASAAGAPMKGMKRASSAGAVAVEKRRKTMMKEVAKTVGHSSILPEATCHMLSTAVRQSLGVGKDARHPFQTTVVGWIGESVRSSEAALNDQVADAAAQVAAAESEQEGKVAAEKAAQAVVDDKDATVHQKKDDLKACHEARQLAKTGLKHAERAQADGDRALSEAKKNKADVEAKYSEVFLPLKEGCPEDAVAKMKVLSKLAASYEMESGMMNSLPSVVEKSMADRGTFDNMVMEQLGAALQKQIADFGKQLSDGAPEQSARANAVQAAKDGLDAATAAEATAASAVAEAQAAAKEAKKVLAEHEEAEAAFNSGLVKKKARLERPAG